MKFEKNQRRELRYFLQYIQNLKECKIIEEILILVLDESKDNSELPAKILVLSKIMSKELRVSDAESLAATFLLAFFYENGLGTNRDIKQALEFYEGLAKQNYAFAQWQLGTLYDDGNVVAKDEKMAFEFYSQAAEGGHAMAQNAIGVDYRHGTKIVKQDVKKAKEFFTKSAEQNCYEAFNNLGDFWSDGGSGEPNEETAFEYYKKAAEDPDADPIIYVNLADSYMYGNHQFKNEELALKHYEKAAGLGDSEAIYNLGCMYQHGKGGLIKDIDKAVLYYKDAMSKGSDYGQYAYACCLLDGLGVEKDCDSAFKLFTKGKIEGHISSQVMLGWCHEFGLGVEKDIKKALFSYQSAIVQGTEFPYRGVEKDLKLAYEQVYKIEHPEKHKIDPHKKPHKNPYNRRYYRRSASQYPGSDYGPKPSVKPKPYTSSNGYNLDSTVLSSRKGRTALQVFTIGQNASPSSDYTKVRSRNSAFSAYPVSRQGIPTSKPQVAEDDDKSRNSFGRRGNTLKRS